MEEVGFIGLGVMGQPMALNMVRAGVPMVVWNRTPERAELLREAGARIADSCEEVFERAHIVIGMLANAQVMDAVLKRGTLRFGKLLRGKIFVHMGTTSPAYSLALQADIQAVHGQYVEAPVSGSRKPAENAQLVGMMAGEDEAVQAVQPWLRPMCREIFACGPVPSALRMKLAVNLFLITVVTGLAEAFHFAGEQGLDLAKLRAILDSGPMASSVSKMKTEKLVTGEFSVQAAILDVLKNSELIADEAVSSRTAAPLLTQACELYRKTAEMGHGALDMAAVIHAIADMTRIQRARH